MPDDAEVMEATGRFLIPGLWDMHVHSVANVALDIEMSLGGRHGLAFSAVPCLGRHRRPEHERRNRRCQARADEVSQAPAGRG